MRLVAHLVLVIAMGAFAYSAGWQAGRLSRAAESDSALLDRANQELLRGSAEHARATGTRTCPSGMTRPRAAAPPANGRGWRARRLPGGGGH